MNDSDKKLQRLSEALADHSAEGVTILAAEPSKLMQGTLLLIGSLMIAALFWSFIGRADVIVTTPGTLSPDSEVRRLYAPIEGEVVDVFISEGQPVSEGDVVARLNARRAIQVAADSLGAELQLSTAKREFDRFPARKALLERQIESLESQIKIARSLHENRVSEGLAKLGEAQRAKLEEARGNLEVAKRAFDVASEDLGKFERLFASPGGGGVSKNQVEQKRSELVNAEANFKLAEARLGELDFQLSREYAQAKAELEGSDQKLTELQIERDTLSDKIQYEENKVRVELRRAELEAEMASRIKFENIDEDNFLRILAPVTGVVTDVAFTQPGDKIQSSTPLGGIAPADAVPVLKVDIPEADRAFLRVGQKVKMKFNAFPYQRYGFIEGSLDYISPSTQLSDKIQVPVFKGRVALDKTYFEIENEQYPLRYGMEATAEIVVRKRRLIDLALDPFRKLQG